MTTRPIEPHLQPVYDRLNDLAAAIEAVLRATTGERCGFTLFIHAGKAGHATLMVTNLATIEGVHASLAEWLEHSKQGQA